MKREKSCGAVVYRYNNDVLEVLLMALSGAALFASARILMGLFTSDAAVIDLTMAQSKLGKGAYADLEVLEGAQYGEEVFAVGLRKDSDLKAKLDKFLKDKYADGTLTALAEKYNVGLNTDALK